MQWSLSGDESRRIEMKIRRFRHRLCLHHPIVLTKSPVVFLSSPKKMQKMLKYSTTSPTVYTIHNIPSTQSIQ